MFCEYYMKLNKKEIKHIANLARLELSDAELDKYKDQLSDVLDWIDQLKEVVSEYKLEGCFPKTLYKYDLSYSGEEFVKHVILFSVDNVIPIWFYFEDEDTWTAHR